MLIKTLSKGILNLFGWKLSINLPAEKKFVLVGAPHTSNWDFVLGMLCFWSIEIPVRWIAKKEMFSGPLRYVFTAMGGIPLDRSASSGFIKQIANSFQQHSEMALALSPEGTRSKTDYWRSGFYYIALEAKVPICLGYIDATSKTIGIDRVIHPSGNIEQDLKTIADFYSNIRGINPEKQGPVRVK